VRLGGEGVWDDARALRDVGAITEEIADFWGMIPYDRYTYLNVVGHGRGGLEHMDSTLMMVDESAVVSDGAWLSWLGLVSHEFFHTWNVKRMRPEPLTTYDYDEEQYTRSLWIAEGLTSYYDDLLLVRAGLMTPEQHLSRLSGSLPQAMSRPAAAIQSLSDASFDAWIKYYRGDENRINRDVSYYSKGAVIGWLLDMRIRRATRDQASLDDVMRRAYAVFREGGYTEAGFRALASEVAGEDLTGFFAAYVDGTVRPDLTPALDWLGLRVAEDPEAGSAWLGIEASGWPMTVDQVRRDAPVFAAGLNVADELIAVGSRRVTPESLDTLRTSWTVGDEVTLLVARHERLKTLTATVGARPQLVWSLELDPDAGRAAALHREGWWRSE